MTNPTFSNCTSFRIRRPSAASNGFSPPIDALVKTHLDELNALLGTPVFPVRSANVQQRESPKTAAQDETVMLLSLPLTPKQIPKGSNSSTSWADGSLADFLTKHAKDQGTLNLSDKIDQTAALAQLKYAFLDAMQGNGTALNYNARAVLERYPFITDYLIAYAYHILKVQDIAALKHIVFNNKAGARGIAEYGALSATRNLIEKEQLNVEGYNDDSGAFIKKLREAPIPLSETSFGPTVRAKIEEFVFDRDEEDIIDTAVDKNKIGILPPGIKPLLVKYIQQSPVLITKDNAHLYLPNFILQIMRNQGASEPTIEDEVVTDNDFSVQFQDDSDTSQEISRASVRCAAQLYHAMVLGEELGVFRAVEHLVYKRLVTKGGLRIESEALRKAIKAYVLEESFIDLKNGDMNKRTRPAERQMFHRQVFNEGKAQVPEDLFLNEEFKQLWKVLMVESARYLQSAQASVNPESFVSRQNVMQAVEDLQYNLSNSCTGMATLMAPLADAELNFVLERVLKHPEIVRQIVPKGGNWKNVVDQLNAEQDDYPGNATTLYNKARLGQLIIEAIADYTPAAFEDDAVFSDFISKVDAFITTQSILSRPRPKRSWGMPVPDGDGRRDRLAEIMPDMKADAEREEAQPAPAKGAPAGRDEWDF
jgi:hypothetical protein